MTRLINFALAHSGELVIGVIVLAGVVIGLWVLRSMRRRDRASRERFRRATNRLEMLERRAELQEQIRRGTYSGGGGR